MNRRLSQRCGGYGKTLLIGVVLAGCGLGTYHGFAAINPNGAAHPESTPSSPSVKQVLATKTLASSSPRLSSTFGQLSLQFEANHGQTDAQVKFLSRGRGYTMFLTPTEAVMVLRGPQTQAGIPDPTKSVLSDSPSVIPGQAGIQDTSKRDSRHQPAGMTEGRATNKNTVRGEASDEQPVSLSVLRMSFAGANQTPAVTGQDKLPGIVNYFIGNDPDKWQTKIPTYKTVHYKSVYDGIDLAYYGNQGQLEYDLIVAPGADPDQIQLAFDGAERLAVNAEGDLVLTVDGGDVRLLQPHVYQMVNGKKIEIAANYVLGTSSSSSSLQETTFVIPAVPGRNLPGNRATRDSGQPRAGLSEKRQDQHSQAVGIQLAAYDTTKSLIIDPVLFFSTYLGGSGFDQGVGVAVDGMGAAFVIGITDSTNFPLLNPSQGTSGGGNDAFVTKLDAAGARVFSTYLGGSGGDFGLEAAVDGTGAVTVTGFTGSTDFPLLNASQGTFGGGSFDGFVTKLDGAGAQVYSTYLGGSGIDQGIDIAIDRMGASYVTGSTDSADFPLLNASQGTPGGGFDAFATKFNAAGAQVYSTYLGGSGLEQGFSVAVDGAGAVSLTGRTSSTDFPTLNASQGLSGGGDDAFVTKLDGAGAQVYSTYLGGTGGDQGQGIVVDGMGAVIVTGSTGSTDFPLLNASQGTSGGGFDAFVTKLDEAGAQVYSTYLGGSGGNDQGLDVAVDRAGVVSVVGNTDSTDFPTLDATQGTSGGSFDAFVTKVDPAGARVFSTYLGGAGSEEGQGVAVDGTGAVLVVGSTDGTFPILNASQGLLGGGQDAFVAKICEDPLVPTPGTWTATDAMGSLRALHTATRLADGQVLIAGGSDTVAAAVGSAQLYDATGSLVGATNGPLNVPRFNHTATLLPNGNVLITGGRDISTVLDGMELYDPVSKQFATGPLLGGGPRHGHRATLLADGRVLLTGGCSDISGSCTRLDTARIYDPSTGTFSGTGTMNSPRLGHRATRLADGTVLITGGGVGTAERYDPSTGIFTNLGNMFHGLRNSHTSTLLSDGRVLIAGGHAGGPSLGSAEIFNPSDNSFADAASLAVNRASHEAVGLPDGRVLLVGGLDGLSVRDSAELYIPGSPGSFTPLGPMGATRISFSLTGLANGQVMVAGGATATGNLFFGLDSAELFTPKLCGPESELSLTTTMSPQIVTIGTDLQVDVQVTNNGPDDAAVESVTVLQDPTGLTLDASSDPGCALASGEVTCDFGTVVNGATPLRTFFLTTTSAPPGIKAFSTTATGPPESFDPNFGNQTVDTTNIVQTGNPDADLSLSVNPEVNPGTVGQLVRYLVSITNAGPDVALGARLTGSFSGGGTVTINSIAFPGLDFDPPIPLDCVGPDIDCDLGDIDITTYPTFFIEATPSAAGNMTLTLNVESTGANAVPDSNSANSMNVQIMTLVVDSNQHVFVVDSILDDPDSAAGDGACATAGGVCTLRAAIQEANATANDPAGPDFIAFDLATHQISPLSDLPTITDPVIIDGHTEPDSHGTPIVWLDGDTNGVSTGLRITAGDSTVRGMIIGGFGQPGAGIRLETTGNNTIEHNIVGTNPNGDDQGPLGEVLANTCVGILVENSPGNFILDNVLSGNGCEGLSLFTGASGNTVQGNIIGLKPNGMEAQPNTAGIFVWAANNSIGGTTPEQRNVISGNMRWGIELFDTVSTGNVVQGNYIGTDITGSSPVPNGTDVSQEREGISINNGSSNTIGGIVPGAGNVISGNMFDGIGIWGFGSGGGENNNIQGNFIGTAADGTSSLPNERDGISIAFQAANNVIGGAANMANTIAFNGGNGVSVVDTTAINNTLRLNSIHSNNGLGIDLGNDGVTPNDNTGISEPDDDPGPNNLQNYPVDVGVIAIDFPAGSVWMAATLTSTPNTTFDVDFFVNTTCDGSDFGEGERYLGTAQANTDGTGNGGAAIRIFEIFTRDALITATATDPNGNTSEFSPCGEVANLAPELGANALTISEGQTVVLSGANLSATDVDNDDATLTFLASSVQQGRFELVSNPGVPETSFTQAQVTAGAVQFVHDGSETAPSYDMDVSDGVLTDVDGPSAATITFSNVNDAPQLGNNALTVAEGQTVVLSGANLSAADVDNDDATLTFVASAVQQGRFELVSNPGVPETSFTQAQVTAGAVQFVHDGSETAPSYDMDVSDGVLTDVDGPTAAAITFSNVNDAPARVSALNMPTVFATEDDPVEDVALGTYYEDVDDSFTLSVNTNSQSSLVSAQIVNGTTLRLTYQADQHGQATIQIQATDGQGAQLSAADLADSEVVVTVGAENDAPLVVGGQELADVTVDEDASPTDVNVTATFADVDIATNTPPDSLTYSVSNNTNPGLVSTSFPSAGTLRLSYTAGQSGAARITVRATDTANAFTEDVFDVTVNNTTPTTGYDVVLSLSDGSSVDPATWLPTVGAVLTISGEVQLEGNPVPGAVVTYTVEAVTSEPGAYTNDPNQTPTADFSTSDPSATDNQIVVTALDYGGRIRLRAESDFDPGSGPIHRETFLTLPRDAENGGVGDGIADQWEEQHCVGQNCDGLAADPGTTGGPAGDGLSAKQKYRGFKWGVPLERVTTVGNGETYQTVAWVPDPTAVLTGGMYDPPHVRGNPQRRELFLTITHYDVGQLHDASCDCPFALGDAFAAAGIDVHVRSTDVLTPAPVSETHLDAVELVNREQVNGDANRVGHDGLTNRIGPRNYGWDRKGESCVGSQTVYQELDESTNDSCLTTVGEKYTETYQIPLDHYFEDKPYVNGVTFTAVTVLDQQQAGASPNGVLDPDTRVRDPQDTTPNTPQTNSNDNPLVAGTAPADCQNARDEQFGDVAIMRNNFVTCTDQSLTAVDINNNGRVELGSGVPEEPADPSLPDFESTIAQVLKRTITHEVGHAVGLRHAGKPTSALMHVNSYSWRNDTQLDPTSLPELAIHND